MEPAKHILDELRQPSRELRERIPGVRRVPRVRDPAVKAAELVSSEVARVPGNGRTCCPSRHRGDMSPASPMHRGPSD